MQVAGATAGRFNAHLTVLRTLGSAAEADEKELKSWMRKTADVSLDLQAVVLTGTAAARGNSSGQGAKLRSHRLGAPP